MHNYLLTSVDFSTNTSLSYVKLEALPLTSLDFSNFSQLEKLDVYSLNALDSINVNGATSLKYLTCSEVALTSLDVSTNTLLETLQCADNKYCCSAGLTTLDLSNNVNLTSISLNSNELTTIDLRNTPVSNISGFTCNFNDNLNCISVQDSVLANTYSQFNPSWNIASSAIFSTNCALLNGCTDVAACNYEPAAVIDDGSCILSNCVTNITKDTYHSTVQLAVDNSASGDTIIMDSGTYTENVIINSSSIVLASKYLTTE